jgi:hypothetical protein
MIDPHVSADRFVSNVVRENGDSGLECVGSGYKSVGSVRFNHRFSLDRHRRRSTREAGLSCPNNCNGVGCGC